MDIIDLELGNKVVFCKSCFLIGLSLGFFSFFVIVVIEDYVYIIECR